MMARDDIGDDWRYEKLLQERDDLAAEIMAIQADDGPYAHGYQRAAEQARQAIEQVRSERDALRAAIRDMGLCLHLVGWCDRCDGLRALVDGAAEGEGR